MPHPDERLPAAATVWPRFRLGGPLTLWLPVVVSFVVQVPAALLRWHARALVSSFDDDPVRFTARLVLALIGPVALVFARRFPGPVVAVVVAAASGYVLVTSGDAAPPYIALAFAVIGAVVRGARLWAWISLGVGWAVTLAAGIALRVPWQPALVVAVSLALVLFVAIGESIRSRRRRWDEARRLAEEQRRSEAQAERMRIARELHDVLAHSLSQISVQAGVGLHLLESRPEEAAKALADIKATSRSALEEVRSVLGVLRDGGGPAGSAPQEVPLVPAPDLGRLDELLDSVRSQGLEVEASVDPAARSASAGAQLAMYRIVQESLTNVVRHSEAGRAAVSIAVTDAGYRVSVDDPGPAREGSGPGGSGSGSGSGGPGSGSGETGSGGAASGGAGRGVLGMRERAELLGGRLSAGPVAEGSGFRVVAELPERRGTS
ncbi:histidine kinase [Herbiconiux sp. KACC 21604]|uniref:sensor histidine kinase n=1 Tax=unclassified Herbiconiux TaxID=2618217 RepID=UPI001490CF47|nr:histidine kinase [Herbiconiux sp. SALV-R1]QJU54102.1 sensor histidine kinase [Herbiconiux sp. SALV-R1]WPO85151.1 histidine kinase [Herbiconiux sp. KACC 21604]